MTWAEYVVIVLEHLTVDANRRGLEDFRNRMIRNSVVDLQRYIRAYRQGHTTTYQVADLEEREYGMIGNLPSGAIAEAFYTVSNVPDSDDVTHPTCQRNRMDFWPWVHRKTLLCTACDARLYAYSISPYSKQFVIHPVLNDETELLLVWEGLKMDFDDGDTVPWPEEAAEASAAYVKWRILLEVDKNPALAREQFSIWSMKRLALYRDEQEKQDAEKPDEEYVSGVQPAPGTTAAQAGSVDLTLGDVSAAVTFPQDYVTAPIVDCWIVPPDATWPTIDAVPNGASIAVSGFTALFAAAIPGSGFKLFWRASPVS